MIMKWRVEVTEKRVVEVEAETEAQAMMTGQSMSTFRQVPVSSTAVSARWVEAGSMARELVELWTDAGEPQDVESTHNGEAEYQADGVRAWAIGAGCWPTDEEQANSVWAEIADYLDD